MAPTYFRLQDPDEDPEAVLDPANQQAQPWGDDEHGQPCDKCRRSGRVAFRDGSVHPCPVCRGTGVMDCTPRPGVSVFEAAADLLAYMRRRDGDVDGRLLVELEGDPSGDIDFDADEGALLIRPTRIVSTREL